MTLSARRNRVIGRAAAAFVLAGLTALLVTTQAGGWLLMWVLEHSSSPVRPEQLRGKVDAIAVLGGRTARIHEAARLTLASDVPLLLIGKGTGDSDFEAESEKMEDILLRQYGIGPRWVETESTNTHENAVYAWCLVSPMGVRKVALLTDSFHMLRAKTEFEAAGFEVVAAPTEDYFEIAWRPQLDWTVESFKPSRAGWSMAKRPVLELGGALAAPLSRMLGPTRRCGQAP